MELHQNRRVGCRNRTAIAPGQAAMTAAELAMPDLDLIKQVEQECGTGVNGSPGAGRAISWQAVDTFARAIETNDFERRLRLVETDCSDQAVAAIGINGAAMDRAG
jgi:hypothetical protein